MDDLLTIGRFGRLAGLSVGALRHYDELDVLRPASVDPSSGYRMYRYQQVATARAIVRLRDLELPLDTIRVLIATDDPAERRRILEEHRIRIEARTSRLQRVLHILGRLSKEDPTTMTDSPIAPATTDLDPTTRRALASSLFNHTWTLLETADRTDAQTDEMIHSAHASRYHWGEVPGVEPFRSARGEWQCSRVYAVIGRAEPALWHARRCLAINEAAPGEDWDIAAAYEAMARAHLAAGDLDEVAVWKAKARAAIDLIADPDDRAVIEGDIDSLP